MGQKNHRAKKTMDCICKMEKMDLNNPKKVHAKHKIRRHFWKPRGQKLSVGKKKIKMAVRRRRNQKGGKLKMFSSPLFRWDVFIRNCGGTDRSETCSSCKTGRESGTPEAAHWCLGLHWCRALEKHSQPGNLEPPQKAS